MGQWPPASGAPAGIAGWSLESSRFPTETGKEVESEGKLRMMAYVHQ